MKIKVVNIIFLLALILLTISCKDRKAEFKIFKVGILQFTNVLTNVEKGFIDGMEDYGYFEGQNIYYEYRNANTDMSKLNLYSKELVDKQVDLIVSITTPSSIAAMKASEGTDIPIVFILVSDPLKAGLVESYKKPGGRITGIRDGSTASAGKRLELLHMMVPGIKKVLSVYSFEETLLPAEKELQLAASKLDIVLVEKQVHTSQEAAEVFLSILPGEVDAVFVPSDAIVTNAKKELEYITMALKLPYIFPGESDGVLAQYGEDYIEAGKQGSTLADKILKGFDPVEIPVELTKNFYLTVNLGVAEKMGLYLSDDILRVSDNLIK